MIEWLFLYRSIVLKPIVSYFLLIKEQNNLLSKQNHLNFRGPKFICFELLLKSKANEIIRYVSFVRNHNHKFCITYNFLCLVSQNQPFLKCMYLMLTRFAFKQNQPLPPSLPPTSLNLRSWAFLSTLIEWFFFLIIFKFKGIRS